MAVKMDDEKFDSTVIEPDLICSKDGDVLARSDRENVRAYEDFLSCSLSQFFSMFRGL